MDETAPNSPQSSRGVNMGIENPQPIEEAQVARAVEEIRREEELRRETGKPVGVPVAAWEASHVENMVSLGPDDREPIEQLSPEERAFREAQYARGGKMMEILHREKEPLLIREAMRNYLAAEERQVYLGARRPSEYVFENVERVIEDRMNELKMAYFGSLQIVKDVRTEGTGRDRKLIPVAMEKDEITELFGELEVLHDEFLGRVALMDLFSLKQAFAGDVNGWLGILEARGARCPQARYFTLMGRLSGGMGKDVNTALHEWTNLAENKVKGIGNPFAEYFFADNLQRSIDYIVGRLIGKEIPEGMTVTEKLDLGRKYDNAVNTAVLSLGLFKNFDFHLTYSIKLEDGKPAVSVSQLDGTKAAYVGVRQDKEETRDHPWNAGLPAAAGVFPNLVKDFFHTVTVKLGSDAGARRVDLWQLWREEGVPLSDLPLDKEHWTEAINYFKRRFPDVKFMPEKYEGMYEHAWLVPYKLAHIYARDIFGLIFGLKTKDVMEVIQNPEAMFADNKAFDLGFDITYSTSGMTSRDIEALRQFTKVTYLAEAVIAAAEKGDTRGPVKKFADRIKRPLFPRNDETKQWQIKDTVVWEAANVSGFASPEEPVDPSHSQPEDYTRLQREKALYDKVVEARRGFMPHELIGSYFEDKEVERTNPDGSKVKVRKGEEQVGRIYRSGAYDYNPNLWKILEDSSDSQHALVKRLFEDPKTGVDRHKMLRERLQPAA